MSRKIKNIIGDEVWKMRDGGRWRVRVHADIEKIIRSVLHRAATNKSKRATAMGGGIVVELLTDTSPQESPQ